MAIKKDLTGWSNGQITVTGFSHKHSNKFYWKYKCECGKVGAARTDALKKMKSCGCLSGGRVTHGYYGTPTYSSWKAMNDRCRNPKATSYKWYGALGIKVCEAWANSFEVFLSDMGERPAGTSLDRIDSTRDYAPRNCKWSTAVEQNNNRSSFNRVVDIGGAEKTIAEWSRMTGVAYSTIYGRLKKGLKGERLIHG